MINCNFDLSSNSWFYSENNSNTTSAIKAQSRYLNRCASTQTTLVKNSSLNYTWFNILKEIYLRTTLVLFRMVTFGAAHGWGMAKRPLSKICHLYLAMMKLGTVIPYLKKIQKIYESRDTPLDFCWHQHFLTEISKFCYTKKYRYRLHFDTWFLILLTFLGSLKIVITNMVTILMMSAKKATPGLLKIKVFWNEGYDVIISLHDVTNKILSCDLNYIVDVVMWPKFGNSSISMKEVIRTSIL